MIDRILGRIRKKDTGKNSVFDSVMSTYRKDKLSKNGYDPLCGMFRQGGLLNGFEAETTALVARMVATGETVSLDEKTLIDGVIKKLKAVSLWNKFDTLWVTRSRIGVASAKFNWIKNAHNLETVDAVTFEANVGFNSDGISSYLKTNYNPATDAVKFTLNSGSFGVRVGGIIAAHATNYTGHGNSQTLMRSNAVNYRNQINGVGGFGQGRVRETGLQTVTSTGKLLMRNYSETALTGTPTSITSSEIWLLKTNDGLSVPCATTEKLEFAFIGAALTEAENDLLGSIIDSYIRGYTRVENNAVSFTFDDMFESDFTVLYPLFKSKNVVSSHNAITSLVGSAGKVTWANIIAMVNDGFDIGDHSNSHQYLTSLTNEECAAEFQAVNDAFIANGLPIPRHGAYPYGSQDVRERTYAANAGRYTMRGNPFAYTYNNSDKFQLPAFDITAIGSAGLSTVLDKVDGCFEQSGKHVMLYGHQAQVGETSGNLLGTIPLGRMIDYCKNIGLQVLSQAQLYEQFLSA